MRSGITCSVSGSAVIDVPGIDCLRNIESREISMKLSEARLRAISSYFTGKPVKRAFLFGSYARGDADTRSDIDLMVELDYSASIGLRFFTMQCELEELLKARVDLITSESVNSYIMPYVEKEKVLIYER